MQTEDKVHVQWHVIPSYDKAKQAPCRELTLQRQLQASYHMVA